LPIYGQLQISQLLHTSGADIHKLSKNYYTALSLAAREGYLDICKFLLDEGAQVNTVDSQGWTPLMLAANSGKLMVCELLCDHGADIGHRCSGGGATAFSLASFNRWTDVYNLLCVKGVNLTLLDGPCFTWAVAEGKTDIVRRYIKAGADIFEAFDVAKGEVLQILCDTGDGINTKDKDGVTPFLSAVCGSNLYLCKKFHEAGADIHMTYNGFHALSHALVEELVQFGGSMYPELWFHEEKQIGLIKFLIRIGSDVNVIDQSTEDFRPRDESFTPLMLAAGHGRLSFCKLLCDAGADVNAVNNKGEIALSMARSRKFEIKELPKYRNDRANIGRDYEGVSRYLLGQGAKEGNESVKRSNYQGNGNIEQVKLQICSRDNSDEDICP